MRSSPTGRRGVLASLGVIVAVGVLGVAASASHSFLDVPDNHLFHGDIEWMKESGVTRGCNPPANTNYCPDDFTTRGEMAAFFHRFARSRTVDAGWLEGKRAADFLAADGKAADSDLLDGFDSSDFVKVGEQVSDSDTLDGFDSSDFVKVGDAIDADTLDGFDSSDFVKVGDAIDADTLNGKTASDFLSSNVEIRENTIAAILELNVTLTASCQGSEQVVGGGFVTTDLTFNVHQSAPTPAGDGWVVSGTVALANIDESLTVYAVCVAAG